MVARSGFPDWKDGSAYQLLLQAERSAFAWEWLRRQADYRAAVLELIGSRAGSESAVPANEPSAHRWGLHRFEDPDLPVPLAKPMWCTSVFRYVLGAAAEPSTGDEDAFILDRFAHLATTVRTRDGESLLLSDGLHSVRLDLRGASLEQGPVRLRYDLEGFVALDAPLLVVRRLRALVAARRFSRSLHPLERKAGRFILVLRTFDALQAGASQREIAAELLSAGAARERWRVEAPSLRSQVQRLVREARTMACGRYAQLLR